MDWWNRAPICESAASVLAWLPTKPAVTNPGLLVQQGREQPHLQEAEWAMLSHHGGLGAWKVGGSNGGDGDSCTPWSAEHERQEYHFTKNNFLSNQNPVHQVTYHGVTSLPASFLQSFSRQKRLPMGWIIRLEFNGKYFILGQGHHHVICIWKT